MKLLWPWEGGTDGQMDGLDMVRCLFFFLRYKIHPPKLICIYKSPWKRKYFKRERIVFQAPFLRGYICSISGNMLIFRDLLWIDAKVHQDLRRGMQVESDSWIHLASKNHVRLMFMSKLRIFLPVSAKFWKNLFQWNYWGIFFSNNWWYCWWRKSCTR